MRIASAAVAIAMVLTLFTPFFTTGDHFADPTYGVRLTARYDPETEETEPLMKEIRLGQEIIFNITVTNVGTGLIEPDRDTIYLSIDNASIPPGWKAWIDTPPDLGNENPDFVRLASDESTTIILHVHSPWEGWNGDSACINITGNSSEDLAAYDTISVYALLRVPVDFDLKFTKAPAVDPMDPHYGEKYSRIDPGSKRSFIISITNKGDVNDTYELNLSEPSDGWDWYFPDTGSRIMTIELSSQLWKGISGATIAIGVECPSDALAYEEGTITVTAWSRVMEDHGENLTRSDTLVLVTNEVIDFNIKTDRSIYYPLQNFTYKVSCILTSFSNCDIRIMISVEGVKSGWIVRYPEEELLLPYNGSLGVDVRITGPGYLVPRLNYMEVNFTVVGSSIRRIVNVTLINGIEEGFDVIMGQNMNASDPWKQIVVPFQIRSMYDKRMNVSMEVTEHPDDWRVKFIFSSERSTMWLDPWEDKYWAFEIWTPKETLMGTYLVNLSFWTNKHMVNISYPIVINQIHDLRFGPDYPDWEEELSLPASGWDLYEVPAGSTVYRYISLKNAGNGVERVHISLGEESLAGDLSRWKFGIVSVGRTDVDLPDERNPEGMNFTLRDLPAGMEYSTDYHPFYGNQFSFREMWVELAIGAIVFIRIQVQAPGMEYDTLTKNATCPVSASVGNYSRGYRIGLSVQYADLKVANVTFMGGKDAKLVDDENATVRILVVNAGNCSAENVLVVLITGGSEIASGRIKRIDPGKTGGIDLTFIADKHIRKYTIEIDPDNEIIESADQFMDNGTNDNNIYSTTVDVKELEKSEGRTSPILFWVVAAIAASILIVGAIQLLSLRRKRRKTKDVFVPE